MTDAPTEPWPPQVRKPVSTATPSDLRGLTLREMTPSSADVTAYVRHVVGGMSPDDVHCEAEISAMVLDGTLRAWWVHRLDEIVAWCALAPRHGVYAPGAWHLYGVWVRSEDRRRGVARALWKYRIDLVPQGSPVTVSIQPDKAASLALAESLGFVRLGVAPPWTNFVLGGGRSRRPVEFLPGRS